jgi:hypothetical protein
VDTPYPETLREFEGHQVMALATAGMHSLGSQTDNQIGLAVLPESVRCIYRMNLKYFGPVGNGRTKDMADTTGKSEGLKAGEKNDVHLMAFWAEQGKANRRGGIVFPRWHHGYTVPFLT